MEVHHHSHHPKKWKEYITEFLMLFLAVTLGFLAENLREVYVEKERSHELILQLQSDIKNNIKLIDSVVLRDKSMLKEFDTAVVYLMANKQISLDSLYQNLPPSVFRFLSKNDTYDQMKNSASLRYIKDSVLLDKILQYASDCESAEARSSSMETEFVLGEYSKELYKWMPQSVAMEKIINDRSGNNTVVNRENTSQLLVDSSQVVFLKSAQKPKQIIYCSEALSEDIKSDLMPKINRRIGLLINTVRFMGVAKQSGLTLLEYIEQKEEKH
jgi:hypothetical protein